jgi:hypothetical protein
MAKLIKERARKPLVDNAIVYTGTKTELVPSETPGMLTSGEFCYTVTMSGANHRDSYVLSLNEEQMLDTVAGWIKSMHDKRDRRGAVPSEPLDIPDFLRDTRTPDERRAEWADYLARRPVKPAPSIPAETLRRIPDPPNGAAPHDDT